MTPSSCVFPPALVSHLRGRLDPSHPCVAGVPDEALRDLVSVVFFAGLGMYEAVWHRVQVVFTGTTALGGILLPEPEASGTIPVYRWKALRFETPRPLSAHELIKLAVVGADDRIYSIVRFLDGHFTVTGLAHEGLNVADDPFLKLIVSRPGELSIRRGIERVVDYERGAVTTSGDRLLFTPGAVRRGLERIACSGGTDREAVPDYLDAVKSVLQEMSAHTRGGMLIISADERPELPHDSPYRMSVDSSLGALLRIARLLARPSSVERVRPEQALGSGIGMPVSSAPAPQALRAALVAETERVVKEIGALTAIDGATVLNRELALIGFGVSLAVAGELPVSEARDLEGRARRPFDVSAVGTRHRAGISYARAHPGSVVFVVSQDGPITCALRASREDDVVVWRLDQTELMAR